MTGYKIKIRPLIQSDILAVEEIAYLTGKMGESFSEEGEFADKTLFCLIFLRYYERYEKRNFFVAIEKKNGRCLGYICGSQETTTQEKDFSRKMFWRIFVRLIFVTSWKFPKSVNTLLRMIREWRSVDTTKRDDFYKDYPAHLHINVRPDSQGLGIGKMLMDQFEKHLIENQVPGVHLETTDHNTKAVPFYEKMGFKLIDQHETSLWGISPVFSLVFGKSLTQQQEVMDE
ncbi:MAG: GNAT family N-acetyltransferase [Anaerolineales bacterium]|nr:GNAT family N-acetyltransferase [Anaerolineales bacterium]